MAQSEETKEAIRKGVLARYEREGRSCGKWIRIEHTCPTCSKQFLAPVKQTYCSIDCRPKVNLQEKKARAVLAVTKRRKKLKEMAVAHKGGCCQVCGYNKCIEALEFHHEDSKEKDFSISGSGNTKAWASILKELEKCILMCANCHREIHFC